MLPSIESRNKEEIGFELSRMLRNPLTLATIRSIYIYMWQNEYTLILRSQILP